MFCGITWLSSMTSNSAVRDLSPTTLPCFVGGSLPFHSVSLSLLEHISSDRTQSSGAFNGLGGSGIPRESPKKSHITLHVTIQPSPYTIATCATFSSQLLVSREYVQETGLAQTQRLLSERQCLREWVGSRGLQKEGQHGGQQEEGQPQPFLHSTSAGAEPTHLPFGYRSSSRPSK